MARRSIDLIEEALHENRRFFALEFFPPKTAEGESNLYPRMEKLSRQLDPLWCGLTLGESAEHSLSIGQTAQSVLSVDMQLNVTATAFPTTEGLAGYLDRVKQVGIRNLLLLRGQVPPPGDGDFQSAADLVRFVRGRYGGHFCLAVAGHPLGYDDDPSTYDAAVRNLKAKADAGADLVISSMVFSAPAFLKFCADCHAQGIHCPILPGIMPVQSRAQFRHWFDKPGCEDLKRRVQEKRHDDAEVKRIGVEFTTALLKNLFRGGVRGAYFFTMNMESVVASIVGACGLNQRAPKEMPWRQSADKSRSSREQQRPIYWSGRPTSYMARTLEPTEDFPNGRYGDAMSPAFGENTTYHTALALSASARRCHWMFSAKTLADVCAGFVAFLEGHGRLPWCEESLAPEAELLLDSTLLPLNRRGLLTINSQPAANGSPSEDPHVGWGPAGGFVYQKQYLEFFCSRDVLARVMACFEDIPSLAVMAIDGKGNDALPTATVKAAGDDGETTTVTWGVFPNRPVLQPTTLSRAAFKAWVPEAFSLWRLPFMPSSASAAVVSSPGSSAASAGGKAPLSGCDVATAAPSSLPGSGTTTTQSTEGADGGAASPSAEGSPVAASAAAVKFSAASILRAEGFPSSMPPVLQAIAADWVLVSVVDNNFTSQPTHLDAAVVKLCEQLPVLSA